MTSNDRIQIRATLLFATAHGLHKLRGWFPWLGWLWALYQRALDSAIADLFADAVRIATAPQPLTPEDEIVVRALREGRVCKGSRGVHN